MSEYINQLRAFFHYLFKHLFESEFWIRILFEILILLLLVYLLLKVSCWVWKKTSKTLFIIIDFIIYDVVLPLSIIITEKFAFYLGSPKWQERATKLRQIASKQGTTKEKQEKAGGQEENKEIKENNYKAFYIGSYILLTIYLTCFHYLLPNVQANYGVFFVPENFIKSCEDFITNTIFSTDENSIECLFSFLHNDESGEQPPSSEETNENRDIAIKLMTESVLLPEYPNNEQRTLLIVFNVSPSKSSFDFNGTTFPLQDGSCYDFKYDGENARIVRVLDFVYIYCEHAIRIFPLQNGVQFSFDRDKWTNHNYMELLEYPDGMSDLPYQAIPFVYDSSPKVYVDGWYEVSLNGKTILTNNKDEEIFKLFMVGDKVRVKTAIVDEIVSSPYETVIFCFDDGVILKYPDNGDVQ